MRLTAPLLLCVALAGCDDLSDSLGPQGEFDTLHAVPDLQTTTFFIRDRNRGVIDYFGTSFRELVGVDTYPLRYEVRVPNETQPQVFLQETVNVEAQREYTYVLTGTAAAVEFTTWERGARVFTDDSILATQYGHAALGFGPLDFYLEAPGANLPGANPQASLAYREYVSDIDVPPGDYVLTITSQGQVGDVLFESGTFTLTARTNVQFAVLWGANIGTSDLIVRVTGDPFLAGLQDVNSLPAARGAHAVFGTDPVDFVIDDEFAMPLLSDVAYEEVTGYAEAGVTGPEIPLDITPAGNPGVSLVEDLITLDNGIAYSLYYIGVVDALSAVQLLDDNRRLAAFARFRVFQASVNNPGIDIYVVDPGEDYLATLPDIPNLRFGATTGYLDLSPGIYDLVFTPAGVPGTVLAELQDQNLGATGIFSFLIADTADVDVVDVIPYDDIP